MNKEQAINKLAAYVSQHEGLGYYPRGKSGGLYEAEFNIKLYNINFPDGYREYVESKLSFFSAWVDDIIQMQRDFVMDQLKEEFEPLAVYITGRSGGWLGMTFPYPENGQQAIALARKIQKISLRVDQELAYIASEEFWRHEWDMMLEFDLEEQAEQAEFDLPFPIV